MQCWLFVPFTAASKRWQSGSTNPDSGVIGFLMNVLSINRLAKPFKVEGDENYDLGLKKLMIFWVPCASLALLACLVSSAFLRAAALGSTMT